MKANASAGRKSPATTGEQHTETPPRVTARNVVDEAGDVETIYRVDGRLAGSIDEVRTLLGVSR